jgi:hypothetical protein
LVGCCLRVKAAGLRSYDDLDRTADGKTEIAVRPPLVDGEFGKPVGILIPESHAWRQITEGPRAVYAFAIQSFAGELAAAAGKDQKDYLLDLIGPARLVDVSKAVENFWDYGENVQVYPIDAGRLRKVVELAAEKSEWGRKLLPPLAYDWLDLPTDASLTVEVTTV